MLDHLKDIYFAGVDRVSPYKMVKKFLTLDKNKLSINTENIKKEYNLDKYKKIKIMGCGKATAPMAKALEEILKDKITQGCIVVKYGHTEDLKIIETIEAGHPVPDIKSKEGAEKIVSLATKGDEQTLFINCISGGGSSLLSLPLSVTNSINEAQLSLKDIQDTTKLLLSCGAEIHEINCIRKHLSGIKGGKLAELLYPGTSINLILSDVVGDPLDSIASGLTAPDSSTFQDAKLILSKYEIDSKVPSIVLQIIEKGVKGEIKETPKVDAQCFKKVDNILIGSNYSALVSASDKAKALGYNTVVLSSQICGEAKEVGKVYWGIAKDIKKLDLLCQKPACIIGGGETTVVIKGKGKGGRNQEMALSFFNEMALSKQDWNGIFFLSGGTDGNDGPTDSAGGFVSKELVLKALEKGVNPMEYLKNNDSYNFFDKISGLFKPGPTNTNVCDIQILIVV